jgi:hypothetical protein
MFCPNCRSEYRAGFTHCPDCDLDLVDELGPPPEAEPVGVKQGPRKLVEVFLGRRVDADLLASLLESNGIPAYIQGAGASSLYPLQVGALGETRIKVEEPDVEDARTLIDEASKGTYEIGDETPEQTDGPWRVYALAAIALLLVALLIKVQGP